MSEGSNGPSKALMDNIQLQFGYINTALEKLDKSVSSIIKSCADHEKRLAVVEALRGAEAVTSADTTKRQDKQIEKNTDYYIGLIKEWGPWIAIGALVAERVLGS